MRKSFAGWMGLSVLLAASAVAQPPKYLDIYTVKIKPDKYGDFMAVSRKVADANRRYKGDNWLAFSSEYGESGLVSFVSPRMEMAQIEKGMDLFKKAGNEAFGPAMEKIMNDFLACTEYSRGELRMTRPDLDRNVPTEPGAMDRLIGSSRWIRNITIKVRPQKREEFEEWLKESKPTMEKADPGTTLIAQSLYGQDGYQYFVTVFASSLEELEKRPSLRTMLGEDGYKRYLERLGDTVLTSSTTISRVRPELSNPPAEIVTVSQDFWTPKPAPVTAARKVKGDKKEKTQQ